MATGKSPLETYFAEIAEIRATGAGTKETSYYPALEKLLTEAGRPTIVRAEIRRSPGSWTRN